MLLEEGSSSSSRVRRFVRLGGVFTEALAELCGIPMALMRKPNKFIDLGEDPRLRNAYRVVTESE